MSLRYYIAIVVHHGLALLRENANIIPNEIMALTHMHRRRNIFLVGGETKMVNASAAKFHSPNFILAEKVRNRVYWVL